MKSKTAQIAELQVENWNLKNRLGTPVSLRLDDDTTMFTITRSEAFVSASGHACCFFERVRGYYLLDRATAVEL
jgi:hypothetical protein